MMLFFLTKAIGLDCTCSIYTNTHPQKSSAPFRTPVEFLSMPTAPSPLCRYRDTYTALISYQKKFT